MGRVKYYLILFSVQIVVAIIVYRSLSTVSMEETLDKNDHKIAQEDNWTYEEENGPKEWVSIDPSYYACGGGYEQSPINIEQNSIWEERSFKEIEFNYQPTKFLIGNNGYTIEVKDPSGKNNLRIDGQVYKLVHIHFHAPSEHQLNGQTFNMEGHLVHQTDNGQIAILGFFIKEGKVNTDLAELWSILPKEETEQPIKLKQSINLLEVLPEDLEAYQYTGSLTIPPCTEGVTWLLFEEPVELSSQQIEVFAEIYSQNNRPIQQLHDRQIYKYKLE